MSTFPSTQATCILPVRDMDRARRFYGEALGLDAVGGKPDGTKAEHTALSFRVDNIADAIGVLKSRGVVFADYDFPGLKTVGHVCVLGSEKAAWFEDPEGNILCLHEELA